MLVWLVYSCCSPLEHRASVKRFASLQFLILRHSVGLIGRVNSPSQGRYLTQTQNTQKQTSMPRVGYEPTIPAFERAKTVHALDLTATVIGLTLNSVNSSAPSDISMSDLRQQTLYLDSCINFRVYKSDNKLTSIAVFTVFHPCCWVL
jgi:hypothetical protein